MKDVAGIDISKGKNTVSVPRPVGEVVAKSFAMGHTGRYYVSVVQFLHDEGIFVSAANPKLIQDYGNNTLRKVKNDAADSRKIARYGLDSRAELRQYASMDTILYQLKTLNRQQGLYTKTKTIWPLQFSYFPIDFLFADFFLPCTVGRGDSLVYFS